MMATTPVPRSSDSEIQCDVCQQGDIDDNDIPTATHYCCDCNESQCTKCNEFHRRLNASKHHKIVNISDNSEREFDALEFLEEDSYNNTVTQTEHQEHLEDPVHVDLPSDARERVKKESDSGIENTNLEQNLEKSRKENKALEQKLNERTQESENLEKHLQESRNEHANLERDLQESRKESKNLEQELQESRKESKNLQLQESRKESKNLKQELQESRKESKNLKQELQESKKETAEVKKQCRILKDSFDKALDREKNLKKELDEIRSQIESGFYENLRKGLDTTSKSRIPQSPRTTSSSESSKLLESKAFVFGIDDGDSVTNYIVKINLNRSDDVSKAQPIPVEMISGSAAAVHCDGIFVTGIGEDCDEIWKYDSTSSNWKKCASLVRGRLRHSVAFVDHILYICGGWVDSEEKTTLDDVEAYDTRKDQCVTVGKLVIDVYGSGNCVPFTSSLYIFGGYDAHDKITNKVQVYDTKLNTCTLLSTSIPGAQCFLRAVLWENTVILLGYNRCLTYTFPTRSWEVKYHFETRARHFGLTISNGLVFVIGGGERKVDADGKKKWICRDDVRCIPLANFLKNEPIDWRHHATLPKPSLVYAFVKMDFVLK